jgi:hypothetical protein
VHEADLGWQRVVRGPVSRLQCVCEGAGFRVAEFVYLCIVLAGLVFLFVVLGG